MAKTPEDKVKDAVKKLIKEVCAARYLQYRIDWHAGSQFTTTLDATGVIAGHAVVIEVKRFDDNASLTARQQINMREFREGGAAVFDIVDKTSLAYFRYWLETLEPREAYMP